MNIKPNPTPNPNPRHYHHHGEHLTCVLLQIGECGNGQDLTRGLSGRHSHLYLYGSAQCKKYNAVHWQRLHSPLFAMFCWTVHFVLRHFTLYMYNSRMSAPSSANDRGGRPRSGRSLSGGKNSCILPEIFPAFFLKWLQVNLVLSSQMCKETNLYFVASGNNSVPTRMSSFAL